MVTAKTRYKDFSPKVQEWMDSVIKTLKNECGEDLPAAYIMQLDLLADNAEYYYQAKQCIRQNGILITGRQGDLVKNPAIAIVNNTQLFIAKLLSQFVLTRNSKARLKEVITEEECALDEFIK